MGKYLLLLLIGIAAACGEDYQWSKEKTEGGIVIAKQFRGETSASGSAVGVDIGSGDLSVGVVSIHESERFDVVFRCEHGVLFTINNPNIYAKLQENDSVIITYKELKGIESDKILDLDFIDANTITDGRSENN